MHETKEPEATARTRYWYLLAAFVCGSLIASIATASATSNRRTSLASPQTKAIVQENRLPSLSDLVLMSPEQLRKQDVALLNLRCAEGLPGSTELNVKRVLSTLDDWAKTVRIDTERNFHQFVDTPSEFENSEGYFRMLMLVTVLQEDFGVHYNKDRIEKIDFTSSQDLFLHGMVGSNNGGTCVSMPVLYTAVARRLGYPVFLVSAKAHLFCRWDGPKERFNIEGSSVGMHKYDDQHYMRWPKPIAPAEVERGHYLHSLTNAEAFSDFLAARGHCFEDNKLLPDARVSYALATKHSPEHPRFEAFLERTFQSRKKGPPRIEDYPSLMRQQEALRKKRQQQMSHDFGIPFEGN